MQKTVNLFIASILLVLISPLALALGIGNLDVQSNLGEPLRAHVKLSDIGNDIGAECFKLVRSDGGGAFPTSMQMEHGAENTGTLHIQTSKPVDDPILNVSLVAACNQDLSREFVLLLDPPIANNDITEPVNNASPITDSTSKQMSQPADKNVVRPKQIADEASDSASVAPIKFKKKKSKKKSKPAIGAENTTDQSISVIDNDTKSTALIDNTTASSTGDAKLYISNTSGLGAPLALRLEKTLSDLPPPDSTDTPIETLTDEDMSDEVTAMSKQLAHLKSQIALLQKRNQELEKTTPKEPTVEVEEDTSPEEDSKWLLYLLIMVAVLSAIAIAEWARRKKQKTKLDDDEIVPWVPDDITPKDQSAEAKIVASAVVEKSASNYTPPPSPIQAEINDDILEQVEVFVAHGRANLAITLLQEYLRENPKRSPAAWLTILDLFKREKMHAEYEEAAAECKRLFNVNVSAFDDPIETDNSSINDYPDAKEQLEEVWGTPDELKKLNELAYNARREPREGFDKNAYLDVLLLRGIAQHRSQTDNEHTQDDKLFADDEIKAVDTSNFEDSEVIDVETLTSAPLDNGVTESAPQANESNEISFEFPELELPEPDASPLDMIEKAKHEVMNEVAKEKATKEKASKKKAVDTINEETPSSKIDKSKPLDFDI